MPDWDEDSPELRNNLAEVLQIIAEDAKTRRPPSTEAAKRWHATIMRGLATDRPNMVGAFRGEPGLEGESVWIGPSSGVGAESVAEHLAAFEETLLHAIDILDQAVPVGQLPDADQLAAIIDLCAWVHAEWVRIHPFGNGNGRTARLWANSIAMRYGLPPFVRLRPRPNDDYGRAGALAMRGNWKPTAEVFWRLLEEFLS